jgi:hypothetical protein
MLKKVTESLSRSKSRPVIKTLADSSNADKETKYQLWENILLQTLMLLIPISIITGMIVGSWGALIVCALGMPLTLLYLKIMHLAQARGDEK